MGGASTEAFASVVRIQNASPSRPEKSLILASVQGDTTFPVVAKQMRRIFGPCGGAARQDVLVAADMDAASEEGTDFEASTAYGKAKNRGKRESREDGDGRQSKKR